MFELLIYTWAGLGIITFFILLKIRAPYGRHTTKDWGAMVSNRKAWFWMELPALIVFPTLALAGPQDKDALSYLLIALWSLHYFNRVIVFPFRIRTKGKKMPLLIAVSAGVFNIINGLLNGYYIGYVNGSSGELLVVLSLLGLALFFLGFIINNKADTMLIALRKNGNGYQIPGGWLFEYISCPNHFGEIIEWIGFAFMARNPAAISFAIWTWCNLAPRARNHHQWYKEKFSDYPAHRKAVIPFVW